MLFANENLLTYKLTIIKIIFSTLVIGIYVFAISSGYINGNNRLIFIIIFLFCLILLLGALGELFCIHENRKFLILKKADINHIDSQSMLYVALLNLLKNRNTVYCIIKGKTTVFKIGASTEYTHRGMEIDYKFYFIDDIQDKHIERFEYRDFNQFIQVLNQINGYRDTFDVVSVDKIVVPKKKKKS